MNLRLGKLAPRIDERTLSLADYLAPDLPPAPASCDWGSKVAAWPMMGNDVAGDCTVACAGHLVQGWTADAQGDAVVIPDSQILAAYSAVSGYVPGRPDTDRGAVVLDLLNYWRTVGIGGHLIGAYAALEPGNRQLFRQACWLFGGSYLGVELPRIAQRQFEAGRPWTVPPYGAIGPAAPGSWGGHAVPAVAYDAHGVSLVTWGRVQRCSWQWLAAYLTESYAILSPDWIAPTGKAPSGFDLAGLQADLAAVTAGRSPPPLAA